MCEDAAANQVVEGHSPPKTWRESLTRGAAAATGMVRKPNKIINDFNTAFSTPSGADIFLTLVVFVCC